MQTIYKNIRHTYKIMLAIKLSDVYTKIIKRKQSNSIQTIQKLSTKLVVDTWLITPTVGGDAVKEVDKNRTT